MPASEKLRKLYGNAHELGAFVREFPSKEGVIAYVGSKRKLANLGYETNEQRKNIDQFHCALYMTPYGAATREEAVEEALRMYKVFDTGIPTA